MRASGILLPVSALPSQYGIGSFSKEAYEFVNQLKRGGQHYWQILPLGPTGYGDSPYQSFSTYAGNPYYIDLETLAEEGLLTKEECEMANLDYTHINFKGGKHLAGILFETLNDGISTEITCNNGTFLINQYGSRN